MSGNENDETLHTFKDILMTNSVKTFFLEIIGIDSISSKTDENPICEVNLRSKV